MLLALPIAIRDERRFRPVRSILTADEHGNKAGVSRSVRTTLNAKYDTCISQVRKLFL